MSTTYGYKVEAADVEKNVSTQEEFLSIRFAIIDVDGTVLEIHKEGFNLATDEDTIRASMQAAVDEYSRVQEAKASDLKKAELNKAAKKTIDGLLGKAE